MTPPPAIPNETPTADFARPVLERQLAELSALAAVGMEIARSLGRTVSEAAEPDAAAIDPVALTLAYSRVSRAVRLTFALQTAVIDKLRGVGRIEHYEAALTAQPATPAAERVKAEDPGLRARKDDIAAAVTDIIGEIHKDSEGGEAHERYIREATERLKEAEDLGDILARPFEEVVEQICRDLGLSKASASFSSSARGGGGPAQPVEGAQPLPTPQSAPSVTALARHATFPASGAGGGSDPAARQIPYTPPPDPDALPGYPVGLPGELPPDRRRRRARPTNYTRGFV